MSWFPECALEYTDIDYQNNDACYKEIRRSLAFPVGFSLAWNDPDDLIPEKIKMTAEWGLFNGLKVDSRYTYSCTIVQVMKWANKRHIHPIWPMSEKVCVWFASERFCNGIGLTTIRKGFSHLADFHRLWGYPFWDWTRYLSLSETLRGWDRAVGRIRKDARAPWLLKYFHKWLDKVPFEVETYSAVLVYTMCLVYFWSMARGGELVANSAYRPSPLTPRMDDFAFHDGFATIQLEASKGDPFSEGCALVLPELEDKRVCPVFWLRHLFRLRKLQPAAAASKYLFAGDNGRPLTRQGLLREWIPVVQAIGLDEALFSLHSFRIGGATELFQRGVSPDYIKILGRWRGPTYELYLRPDALQCVSEIRRVHGLRICPDRKGAIFSFGPRDDL